MYYTQYGTKEYFERNDGRAQSIWKSNTGSRLANFDLKSYHLNRGRKDIKSTPASRLCTWVCLHAKLIQSPYSKTAKVVSV